MLRTEVHPRCSRQAASCGTRDSPCNRHLCNPTMFFHPPLHPSNRRTTAIHGSIKILKPCMISAEAFSTKQSHEPASPAVNHLGLLQQQHTQGKFRGQSFYDKYCPQLRVKKKKKKNEENFQTVAFTEPLCMLLRRLQHSTVFSFLLFTGCAEAGVTVAPSPRSHASQGRCEPVCGGGGCGAAGKVFWRQWEGRIK